MTMNKLTNNYQTQHKPNVTYSKNKSTKLKHNLLMNKTQLINHKNNKLNKINYLINKEKQVNTITKSKTIMMMILITNN